MIISEPQAEPASGLLTQRIFVEDFFETSASLPGQSSRWHPDQALNEASGRIGDETVVIAEQSDRFPWKNPVERPVSPAPTIGTSYSVRSSEEKTSCSHQDTGFACSMPMVRSLI